jgi:hypothetical protein
MLSDLYLDLLSVPDANINHVAEVNVNRARALEEISSKCGGGPRSIHSSSTGGERQEISANLQTCVIFCNRSFSH